MTNIFSDKKILVAGGTGLVGQQLVPKLITLGGKVFVASLDDKSLVNNKVEDFYNFDLMNLDNCIKITKDKEIVFNLLGVTGSPKINVEKPASFMMSNIYCAINLLVAAQISKVKKYLYTSTYGVYAYSTIMKEDDVWKTFPSENHKFAGWAKRIGELQIEAFKIEYNFKNVSIVRPANVYGPFDNFDETNGMVIPSLISKAFKSKKYLKVWGDGSEIRDFIYSTDVAKGMAMTLYEGIKYPINLGSGKGVSIRTIAEVIAKSVPNGPLKVSWDKSKPSGDKIRLMNVTKAIKMGFKANIDIVTGIKNTIDWYANSNQHKRYNAFTEKF